MLIRSVRIFHVPGEPRPDAWCPRKPHVLVRIELQSGVFGWGEAYTLRNREGSLIALLQAMAGHLTGRHVSDIKAFTHWALNGFGEHRAGIDVFCASSGLEIAMWDAVGRSHDTPVYRLMGGTCHDKLDAYANIWSFAPRTGAELARKAIECAEQGFSAIKFYPFPAGSTVSQGIETVQQVREAVGPDMRLAIDLWRHATYARAEEICRRLEPYDIFWVEDAVPPVNPKVLRRLRDRIRQPLLTGETLATKQQFLPLLEHQAVGIINPDVCACGGMLELREIAALADVHQILVSPHNFNSMATGLAATMHVAAGIPNLLLCEFFPEMAADLDDFCDWRPVPENGFLTLSDRPGLGIDYDPKRLEAFEVQ
jgi:galactonate dehydratase